MKQILISFYFTLCTIAGSSQQFETMYDHNGFSNDGGAIVSTSNGYFTTHLATDPVLSYTTLVAAFDEQGALLWDTSLSSPTEELGQSHWNTNILSSTNIQEKWVLGNFVDPNNSNRTAFLYRFTIDGQPINELILDTLFEQRPDVWGGISTFTGIYLLCRDNTIDGTNEILIAKCSLEGQYQWHLTYDAGFTFNPKCIVDVGDGFILGGSRYATLTDQGNGDGQQYIRKFNYEGVSQWTNTLAIDDNPNLGAIGIVKLDNGNYLFAGTKFIDNVSIQPLIGELEAATGDTLWTKVYFESEEYDPNNLADYNSINRIHGFQKLSSGGYLGVGECRHEIIPNSAFGPLDNAAFMMKLDSEYNLLWKRVYVPEGYAELDASPAQCQLNDFVENEDGSITALGRVYMYTGTGPQGSYIQDSYLIKVDSLGCLVSGCDVGITEYENLETLLVYPNPTSELVNFEFPCPAKWSMSIFDMQGKLMNSIITPQCKKFSMEMQTLPAGIYTVVCSYSGDKIFTQRIIKQ